MTLASVLAIAAGLVAAALVIKLQPAPDRAVPPPSYELIDRAPPSAEDLEPIVPSSRLLIAVNETGAWRALAGACPGTVGTLEYTTDGGATWIPSTSAGEFGVTSLLSLSRGPSGSIEAIGRAPEDCTPQLLTTTARADGWEPAAGVELEWYIVPEDASAVNSPDGIRATPCDTVVRVRSGIGGNAAVLCADHRFFRTQDGGASWDDGILLPGARSFAESQEGYIVAAVGRPRCPGVRLQVVYEQTAPRDGASAGCYETTADTTEVSISIVRDAVWLWVGDEIAVTADRGATWN